MVKIPALASAALIASTANAAPVSGAPILQEILDLEGSPGTRYSSDFTRNIFVKQIHSHNDYWRDVPLYTALSNGVQSVEADVWTRDSDSNIYVGHHQAALNSNRTFASLYIDPLVEILTNANPANEFTDSEKGENGVFDTDRSATLYLFVDVKTNGTETWPRIVEALQPLREKNWLTTFNGTDIIYGPVTVIGTGNTPYNYLIAQNTRDYFFDAPLTSLNASFPTTLNPIASASLKKAIGVTDLSEIAITGLNDNQIDLLKSYIDAAHEKGIKTRVWDVSWWPIQKRDALFRNILQAGSDFLNADDLELASKFV